MELTLIVNFSGEKWRVCLSDSIPEGMTFFTGIIARVSDEDLKQAYFLAILSYYFQLTSDGPQKEKTK